MSADPDELKATTGLEHRFRVERLKPSSRGIDHTDCSYFVLDPKHDSIARVALQVYANTARAHGQTALADDLDELVRRTAEEDVEELARNATARLRTMVREAVGEGKPFDLGESSRDALDELRTLRDIEHEAELIGEQEPTLSPEEVQRRARTRVLGEG